jgi:hypothetical protein
LNDPESAQFTEMKSGKATGNVCGLVNAKNRMGGYVSASPFMYSKGDDAAMIVTAPEEREFRALWYSIKAHSSFTSELGELNTRCAAIDKWQDICGSSHPQVRPAMCTTLLSGDGAGLYKVLKASYDD